MKFNLDLIIANSEGALERVLGTLRQRSFSLIGLSAGRLADANSMSARITIEGDRPVESIIKQIAKLYDVKHIAVSQTEAPIANVQSHIDAYEELELCASL
jgi:acetolactate synthase II small subunit